MGLAGIVEGGIIAMIGPVDHVKYFRHQCTTLIQICRHLWENMEIMDGNQYELYQRFVAVADRALQTVAFSDRKMDKKQRDKQLQEKLDETTLELAEYCDKLSGLEDYNPRMLMAEARLKDEEHNSKIISTDNLKKMTEFTSEVTFYIHEGSGSLISLPLKISRQSTVEDVLLEFAKDPNTRIKLHENPSFYTRLTRKGEGPRAIHLELVSGPSAYCVKKGFADFKDYFNSAERGPVHVLVDRNPSIHILLTTRNWSRLFSLAMVIENETVVVLKGVDGTLYHAQDVVEKLTRSTTNTGWPWGVFQLDENNMSVRTNLAIRRPDIVGALCEARYFIHAEGRRHRSPTRWLIEIPFTAPGEEPSFAAPKTKVHYRPGLPHSLAHGSSTFSVPASSMRTTSQGSGTSGGSDATRRVRERVERLENERKEAEKREKEKKGLFTRMFGGKEITNRGSSSFVASLTEQTPQEPETNEEPDIPSQLKEVIEGLKNNRPTQATSPVPITSVENEGMALVGSRVKRWSRSLRI